MKKIGLLTIIIGILLIIGSILVFNGVININNNTNKEEEKKDDTGTEEVIDTKDIDKNAVLKYKTKIMTLSFSEELNCIEKDDRYFSCNNDYKYKDGDRNITKISIHGGVYSYKESLDELFNNAIDYDSRIYSDYTITKYPECSGNMRCYRRDGSYSSAGKLQYYDSRLKVYLLLEDKIFISIESTTYSTDLEKGKEKISKVLDTFVKTIEVGEE